MEENKITQKLFDLVSSKSFDLLNEEEKKLVLTEMTEDEYKTMYELNRNMAVKLKQNIASPADSLKDKLLSSYDKKYGAPKQKTKVGAVLFLKVPLYQAAAAVLLAVFISTAIYYFSLSAIAKQPGVVYKLKTDTIFVQTKKSASDIDADSLAVNNPGGENSSAGSATNHSRNYSLQRHEPVDEKTGRSIKQDNDLKQFMVASLRNGSIS